MFLYNIGMATLAVAVRFASLFNGKARLMRRGHRHVFRDMRSSISASDRVIWVHCASLGEFEQGRPVIEALRAEMPDHKIVLTFFSPSGYEIRKDYEGVDFVCYLPIDTPFNARRFIEVAHPEIAVIVKYEFWLNYLKQLKRSGCRTFIVSAIFRRRSIFFRWYGAIFRRALGVFETLFVQNDESARLLAEIGVDRVVVAGDTRFDRVAQIARAARRDGVVERFAGSSPLFVGGSTWAEDEALILQLIALHPDFKFIVAPHQMNQERIDRFINSSPLRAVRYLESSVESDFSSVSVMVIDTIGILSSLYQYATLSYIGGGFGVGIHNTLEAVAFGLPVAFGPNYHKFKEAHDLIELSVARSVDNFAELEQWFGSLVGDSALYNTTRERALDYMSANQGATALFMEQVMGDSK